MVDEGRAVLVDLTRLTELCGYARPTAEDLVPGGTLTPTPDALRFVDGQTTGSFAVVVVVLTGGLADARVDAVVGGDVGVEARVADAQVVCAYR